MRGASHAAAFFGQLFQVSLHGGGGLAFAFRGGLFVSFAATHFGEYTGFFAGALETAQGDVKGFVFFYSNCWHIKSVPEQAVSGQSVFIAHKQRSKQGIIYHFVRK